MDSVYHGPASLPLVDNGPYLPSRGKVLDHPYQRPKVRLEVLLLCKLAMVKEKSSMWQDKDQR
uniref:Uncharacterized protein n=1 Tax=Oryza meyeriana var. granulata TaxID=110450 RepID=A0A1V1H993_9ORYZ|nr:hypothetical protein [Oryza meyeriana var. granulata]